MIDITLLGPPRVEVDGRRVGFDTRKAMALLAYLALSELPRPRDLLADLLWEEGDTQHARGALRRTLSAIRAGVAADLIEADRSTVALRRGPDVVVDVRSMRHAVADGDLERGAALHGGSFLEGLVIPGAPAFEDWQQTTAESLRSEHGSLLRRLVALREGSSDLAGALEAARQWLALDELHEPAHQTLIRLTAACGDRSGALTRYRDCVRILDQELGVPPLAETTALYEAVRNTRVQVPSPPSAPPSGSPRPDRRAGTPLVGREAVLRALLEAHRDAARQGRVVVIEGEAGIGKTRLAEELLTLVGVGDTVTLTGRAFEEEAALSFAPVVQALRSRLLRDGRWSERLSDNARQAAGRLLPELLEGRRPSSVDAGAPGAEERFFAGVWETLVAAVTAGGTPSGGDAGVFVLDDAQWADDATMALLAYGSRRLRERPLLLVLTWRTPSERPLRRVLAELERSGEAVVHTLDRLELTDVDAVARAVRPDACDPEHVRRLFAESEGLPFLVVEYLQVLDASSVSSDEWSLPTGARDLMRARLGQVSEVGRQLLAAAAVIGRSFDADGVRLTSGRAEEEVVTGLEELAGHGLIREGGQEYDFSHETLRALVHADMSLARRRLLHRRAAQVSTDPASQARHLQLAGDAEAAAAAHVRAAAQARSVFANAEALAHLDAALALGHPQPAVLEVEAGELLTLRGDYPAAVASLERAAATADPLLLATIEHRLGQVHHRSGSWALAEAHLTEALTAVAPGEDGRRARIAADLSLTVLSAGDSRRAAVLAADALASAESAADLHALAQANNLLGLLASRAGATEQAVGHLEASLALAEEVGDHAAQVAALNNLALAYRDGGAGDAAVEHVRHALRLCTEQGDRHREAALHNNLADLLHARGDTEEAMDHLKLAVATFADVGAVADEQAEIWKLVQW